MPSFPSPRHLTIPEVLTYNKASLYSLSSDCLVGKCSGYKAKHFRVQIQRYGKKCSMIVLRHHERIRFYIFLSVYTFISTKSSLSELYNSTSMYVYFKGRSVKTLSRNTYFCPFMIKVSAVLYIIYKWPKFFNIQISKCWP